MKVCFLLCACMPFLLCAETPQDSLSVSLKYAKTGEGVVFRPKQLIWPAALIGLGVYGAIDDRLSKDIRKQTVKWNGNTRIDDALVFLPGASIYLLDWCGVESKHSLPDKTVVAATAAALTLGSVWLLKGAVSAERPDGSDRRSFPSLHTAVAFAGAELLWQEYKHRSPWYGIVGYGAAACTGWLRVYNDQHWTADVLAGAGIGLLSAKAAYWLYPSLRRLYAKPSRWSLTILPSVSASSFGVSMAACF